MYCGFPFTFSKKGGQTCQSCRAIFVVMRVRHACLPHQAKIQTKPRSAENVSAVRPQQRKCRRGLVGCCVCGSKIIRAIRSQRSGHLVAETARVFVHFDVCGGRKCFIYLKMDVESHATLKHRAVMCTLHVVDKFHVPDTAKHSSV